MINHYIHPYLLAFIISFLISVASLLIQINWSRHKNLGQSIRSDGPQSHHQKSGTPTMGGLSFLLGALVTFILFPAWHTPHNLFLMAMVMGLGFLGGLDDFLILKRGKNQGLYGRQKILGQLIMAVIFAGFLIYKAHHLGVGTFLSSIGLGTAIGYFCFAVWIILSASNAVNLTDGLDGLATGLTLLSVATFSYILYHMQLLDLLAVAVIFSGALLAFLLFNKNPAKIFMGDCGSLALGGLLAGFALLSHKEIIFIVIAGVFVLETVSVILQVFSFKVFKRRIFKMSPLHHHFELSGWSEKKVVRVFWAMGLIFSLIGVWLF